MKRVLFFVLFALAFNGVFAEYKTINTKYFSIVYETSSERAASHLAENADKIADELFTYYSVKPFKSKFPIFLKPFEENLNGYYTSAPYQHIVLYDTVPVDNVLSNTTDTLLAVFTHELTHAITMKGVFSITRPLAIREGVTVMTESLHGEGRLNDPRVKQLLAQDKFDGTFFQWNQIDMRDTVPGASLGYLYGGTFSQFLIDVYGTEKYLDFLNMHPKWFTTGKFKRAFDKSISELFEDFESTIAVPAVTEPNILSPKKCLYTATASLGNLLAAFDANDDTAYSIDTETGKRTKLFSMHGDVYTMSFSADGSLLLVSYFTRKSGAGKTDVSIYDMQAGKFLPEYYPSCRYACTSTDNESICAVKTQSQNVQLVLIDRRTKTEKILLDLNPQAEYTNILGVAPSDNGFAIIAGNGIKRDILFIAKDNTVEKLLLPFEAQAIGNLSAQKVDGQTILTFSYSASDSFMRVAQYNVQTKTLTSSTQDFDGGIHYPSFVFDTDTSADSQGSELFIAAVAQHATYNLLVKQDTAALEPSGTTLTPVSLTPPPAPAVLPAQMYNPIMNMWIPTVAPYILPGTDLKNTSYGLHFASQDVISRLAYAFSLGIIPVPTFANIDFTGSLLLKAHTLDLSVSDNVLVQNKNFGIRRTGFGLGYTLAFHAGHKQLPSIFNTKCTANWYAPIQLSSSPYKQKYTDTVIAMDDDFAIEDVTVRERLGRKFFAVDRFGVANNVNTTVGYDVSRKQAAFQIQDYVKTMIPVVPLTVEGGFAVMYNSTLDPTTASIHFNGTIGKFAKARLPVMFEHAGHYTTPTDTAKMTYAFGGQAILRFFSFEIQKTSRWLPLCFNRMNFDLGYKLVANKYKKSKPELLQAVFTNITMDVNGAATIGITYSQPILKGVKTGSFNLIFDIKAF